MLKLETFCCITIENLLYLQMFNTRLFFFVIFFNFMKNSVFCIYVSEFPVIKVFKDETIPDPPNVTNHKNLNLLDHDSCGPVPEQKIIGGIETGIFEFPWMALLQYEVKEYNRTYDRLFCGGTIINKRYILTAAHCVTNFDKNVTLTKIRLGEHNLKTDPDCEKNVYSSLLCADKYKEFEIEKIIPHPRYEEAILGDDIALVKLKQDIEFKASNNISPICLPFDSDSNLIRDKDKATTTGWGFTENLLPSDKLLKVHLPIISNKECKEAYDSLSKKIEINYKQICAGGKKGRDTCNRDSGGPLQRPAVYNKDVKFVQHGIISFGDRRCDTNIPGVYTRVSYFMDWILDNIDN